MRVVIVHAVDAETLEVFSTVLVAPAGWSDTQILQAFVHRLRQVGDHDTAANIEDTGTVQDLPVASFSESTLSVQYHWALDASQVFNALDWPIPVDLDLPD